MTHHLTFLHGDRSYKLHLKSVVQYATISGTATISSGTISSGTWGTHEADFPEVGTEGILASSVDGGTEVWTKVRITKNEGGVVDWEEQ